MGHRFLSSTGTGQNCALPMKVPNPSPVMDKNRALMGPEMLSRTGLGRTGLESGISGEIVAFPHALLLPMAQQYLVGILAPNKKFTPPPQNSPQTPSQPLALPPPYWDGQKETHPRPFMAPRTPPFPPPSRKK